MLNVIKMDIYRLFHTVSTWVMVLFVIGVTVFSVYMTQISIDDMQGIQKDVIAPGLQVEGEEVHMNAGFYFDTRAEWFTGDIKFSELLETQLSSGMFLLFISIFVSIFVYAEQKNGFVKNIAGQLPNRWMLVLSKSVAVAVQVFFMFMVLIVSLLVAGKVFWGEKLVWDSVLDVLKILGGQYLLHMGFAYLIQCLCQIFKSVALSMTLGIMISSKVVTVLYFGINTLLDTVFHVDDFDISRYAIEMSVTGYSISAKESDIIRMLLVGLGCVVITILATTIVIQKRDVK